MCIQSNWFLETIAIIKMQELFRYELEWNLFVACRTNYVQFFKFILYRAEHIQNKTFQHSYHNNLAALLHLPSIPLTLFSSTGFLNSFVLWSWQCQGSFNTSNSPDFDSGRFVDNSSIFGKGPGWVSQKLVWLMTKIYNTLPCQKLMAIITEDHSSFLIYYE